VRLGEDSHQTTSQGDAADRHGGVVRFFDDRAAIVALTGQAQHEPNAGCVFDRAVSRGQRPRRAAARTGFPA
jgi:hypothetical protein